MELGYNGQHRKKMLNSGRKGGFRTGKLSVVARYVSKFPKTKKILDFGSGYYASNLIKLRNDGFDITGYDLPENTSQWSEYFDKDALSKEWDIIMLSNVVNIQPDLPSAVKLLSQLHYKNLSIGGIIIFNIPTSPRYFKIDKDALFYTIKDMTGEDVEKVNTVYTISK